MKSRLLTTLCAGIAPLVFFLATSSVEAITVTEAADYSNSQSPFSSFAGTLTSGLNTISGSLNGLCVYNATYNYNDCNPGSGGGDSQDSFRFQVASGYQITSIVASVSNTSGPSGYRSSFMSSNVGSGDLGLNVPTLQGNDSTGNLLSSLVGPGIYGVSFYGQDANTTGAFTANWSLAISVSSVPVPPAAWLLGSGLLGLVGVSRTRRG